MRYSFEDFVLDRERAELTRAGAPVAVEPQVFDLLVHLVEQRERVVSKDDLIATVWNGRIVSESTLTSRINAARRALGDSGDEQRLIKTIVGKGLRFVGAVREEAWAESRPAPAAGPARPPHQDVTFCRTPDGVNLAIASAGAGPPLIKTGNWLNHVEHDWQSPIWGPFLHRLAQSFRLIRYDGAGNGLSDRNVTDISFARFERDLETVVEATRVPRFALFGMSQGAATAIAYAARHPDRVTKLVLVGAYPQGRNRRGDAGEREVAQGLLALMRHGWGDPHSAFMKAFSSVYLPGGLPEEIAAFAEMQRVSTSGENAVKLRLACDEIDVVDLLPQVKAPTLVVHARHDAVVPFEQGLMAARAIPGARLVALETHNHILLPKEPAWERLMAEVEGFLGA